LGNLLWFGVGVELADETIPIFGGTLGKMVDEGLDLIPIGITQGGSLTKIGGISLHEAGIEVMLSD
jgi:hypothetical protein